MAALNNGFALALRTALKRSCAGWARGVLVQFGGFDTHAGEGMRAAARANLMGTFGDGVAAFCEDPRRRGPWNDTLILQFSEFGRRVFENGSQGTDHGAAAVMMAAEDWFAAVVMTAPSLDPNPANPTPGEQRRRRAIRDRLPLGLRQRARQLARRELGNDPRWRFSRRRTSDRLVLVWSVVLGPDQDEMKRLADPNASVCCTKGLTRSRRKEQPLWNMVPLICICDVVKFDSR